MIIRSQFKRYARIPLDLIEDKNLSWDARMILIYLLSRPDHWEVKVNQLVKVGSFKRNKIYDILKSLQEAGYLRYHRKGTGHTEWYIYDTPQPHPEIQDESDPHPKISHVEIRDVLTNRESIDSLPLARARVAKDKPKEPISALSEKNNGAESFRPTSPQSLQTTNISEDRIPPPPPETLEPDGRTLECIERLLKAGWVTTTPHIEDVIEDFLEHCREHRKWKWDYQAAVRRWLKRQAKWEKESPAVRLPGSHNHFQGNHPNNDCGFNYGQDRRLGQRKLSVAEEGLEHERQLEEAQRRRAQVINGESERFDGPYDCPPLDEDEADLWAPLEFGSGEFYSGRGTF